MTRIPDPRGLLAPVRAGWIVAVALGVLWTVHPSLDAAPPSPAPSPSPATPRASPAASAEAPLPDPGSFYDQYLRRFGNRDRALAEIGRLRYWQDEAWRKNVLDHAYRPRRGGAGSLGITKPTSRAAVRASAGHRAAPAGATGNTTVTPFQTGTEQMWQGTRTVGRAMGDGIKEGWEAGKRGASRLGDKIGRSARTAGTTVWTKSKELLQKGSDWIRKDDRRRRSRSDDDDDDDDSGKYDENGER